MRLSALNLMLLTSLLAAGETVGYFNNLNSEKAQKEYWWATPGAKRVVVIGEGTQIINNDGKAGFRGIIRQISAVPYRGKRIRCSVEVKAKDVKALRDSKRAGKFMVTVAGLKKTFYPQNNPKIGTYGWTPYSFDFTIPADAKELHLTLGFEFGTGTIFFRNLKVEVLDTFLDLSKQMNMGYTDRKAGDGKGGWSDQGSGNDACKFNFKQTVYAGVPFKVINPALNNGKSIMTFKSSHFIQGIPEANLDLSKINVSGKYLYLLHSSTYGTKEPVGQIELSGKNGKKQIIDIKGGRDVNDWWNATPAVNAHPASVWTTSEGGIVGIFASAFKLNSALGQIVKVRFVPKHNSCVWIVLAATISDKEYKFPQSKIDITKQDAVWKNFTFPARRGIIEGSALYRGEDQLKPCGIYGRVIINKDGNYVYEKKPDQEVRFLAALFPNNLVRPATHKKFGAYVFSKQNPNSKELIRDMVKFYRGKGYNMLRMHCIEDQLCLSSGLPIPKDVMDNFHWAIKCMKDEGIYLNLDVAASGLGYYQGIPWLPKTWRKDHKNAKSHIYFDQELKQNWIDGAKAVLLSMNPYTKTRLIDDPVLVNLIGFNEQEFVFSNNGVIAGAQPYWKEFLQKKYGTIDKVKAAWKSKADWKSFDDLPAYRGSFMMETSPKGRDAYDFTRKMEGDMLKFYITTLRSLGWKGPITNFNMGKSIQYVLARVPADYVAMNGYFAHPQGYISPGATITQASSIGTTANVARGFYSYQMIGKPYVITEQGHVFWNNYRYEQAFVTDGYGALQGINGITAFIGQDNTVHGSMHPFNGSADPVMHAEEFLAYYIFRRGDVQSPKLRFRLVLNEPEVLQEYAYRWGIGSEQTNLTLLARFTLEVTPDGKPIRPLAKDEIAISRTGGSAVQVAAYGGAGFTSIIDSKEKTFDVDRLWAGLKKQGKVPANNRTNAAMDIFESVNGELYLNAKAKFMSINTPKLQGVCALAGTKTKLPSFEVLEMQRNGNLAAVSVDKAPSLEKSKRIVIVYATNALNTGMVFNDETHQVMQKRGVLPVLCQTGKFTVAVKNANAAKMKAYALDLNGKRQAQLPVKIQNGKILLSVDTGKLPGGPAVFFELAEK